MNETQPDQSLLQETERPPLASTVGRTRTNVGRTLTSADSKVREFDPDKQAKLFSRLKRRFESKPAHYDRPAGIDFESVKKALEAHPELMWSVARMEEAGGKPDVIAIEGDITFIFADCSEQSPRGLGGIRRGLTYDQAVKMAKSFGVDIMDKEYYEIMQRAGKFDFGTWSWIKTPNNIRRKGSALVASRNSHDIVYVDRTLAYSKSDYFGWRGVLKVLRA